MIDGVAINFTSLAPGAILDSNRKMHKGALIFVFFYFPFGPGVFYPIRAASEVQILFGSFEGPFTLDPKMKLLPHAGNPVQLSFFYSRIWDGNLVI